MAPDQCQRRLGIRSFEHGYLVPKSGQNEPYALAREGVIFHNKKRQGAHFVLLRRMKIPRLESDFSRNLRMLFTDSPPSLVGRLLILLSKLPLCPIYG